MEKQLQANPAAADKIATAVQTGIPMVKYTDVKKSFGDLEVLHGIILEMAAGEKIAIIGPSGSGKTTLGRMLMTLDNPTSGTIEVEGEHLWHMEHKGKLVPANEKHL